MPRSVEYILKANELLYDSITKSLSDQSVKKYNNDTLSLADLDKWRTDELPSLLKERYEKDKNCWLTKDELVLLMDWKLAKGVFRPTLPKLIKSNPPEQVEDATKLGFDIFLTYAQGIKKSEEFWNEDTADKRFLYSSMIRSSFKKICELKGVGPATASLILSLLKDIDEHLVPPFFSDESMMFYVVDPKRSGTKIKYSVKEYADELLPAYYDILFNNTEGSRNMDILERGGWALKMYDIHKFDSLADLKVPFEIEDAYFSKYIDDENEDKIKNTVHSDEDDKEESKRKRQKK